MITCEFTAQLAGLPKIFCANHPDDNPGLVTDFVEVPLRLLIPHGYIKRVGVDQLQDKIITVVKEMVEKLNYKIL